MSRSQRIKVPEENHKKKILMLRFFIGLIVIILGVWGYFTLTNPYNFPVKIVKITGDEEHISHQKLRSIIAPIVRKGFFVFNATDLKRKLTLISWIKTVNIRRIFPSTIVVTIINNKAAYVWNDDALLTAEGELFTPPKNTFPKNLPKFYGPVNQQKFMLAIAKKINDILSPLNIKIQQLSLSSRHAWRLTLDNGIQVTLGQQKIWQRLQQMVAVYPKIIGNKAKKVISIDLRYPNGLSVKWTKI